MRKKKERTRAGKRKDKDEGRVERRRMAGEEWTNMDERVKEE